MYYVLVILFVILISGLRIIKEYERSVIFFLGKQTSIRGPGLIYLIPIFEKMVEFGGLFYSLVLFIIIISLSLRVQIVPI